MAYGHKQHHHHQAKHVHHPHKKKGGRIDMKVSGNPDVFEEAAEKHKKGGRVHHHEMHGHHSKHRSDRPGRKKGGRVSGSNNNPFSSAHHGGYTSSPKGSPSPHDTYGGEKND